MEDNKFWALFWKLVIVAICTLIVSISSCTAYESSLVKDMVLRGADPIKARCSLSAVNLQVLCASAK